MNKRASYLRSGGLIVLDALLINGGFALAYLMRYQLQIGREVATYAPYRSYVYLQLALTGLLLLIFKAHGLYDRPRRNSWVDEYYALTTGSITGVAAMIVIVFYARGTAYSRLIFVYALVMIVLLLILARMGRDALQGALRRRGIGIQRVIVVGAGNVGVSLMQSIIAQPELGYQLIGFVDDERKDDVGPFRNMGRASALPGIVGDGRVDEVFIALPSPFHHEILQTISACRRGRVNFRIVPDLFELSLSRVDIDQIDGIPLIGLKEVSIRGWNLVLKRVLDVLGAGLLLLLFSPVLLLVALLIKLDSPGPVLFRQERIGKHGISFTFYKFRSMHQNAEHLVEQLRAKNEASGPLFKMRRDPRLTRVGKWIRKASIDELPQLFNVLLGEMSVVGPRPPLPSEVEQYREWHMKRLEVSPGITGLWQVNGRSELTFDEMVMLDIYYIENWSLGLDFKIMLRTPSAVLRGHGAY